MEKSYSPPYIKEYAKKYNSLYLLDDTHFQHTEYELNIIRGILKNKKSWLDVACGTGYHLDNINLNIKKCGIDRSSAMIDYAKENTDNTIEYHVSDVKDFKYPSLFDLVTFLWIGYVHSKSVPEAVDVLVSASKQVDSNGSFLVTFCDPMYIFERVSEKEKFLDRGYMYLDGVVWSYKDDVNKFSYQNLIAPNRFKILDAISSSYDSVTELVYPKQNNNYWKKSALLFKGKK